MEQNKLMSISTNECQVDKGGILLLNLVNYVRVSLKFWAQLLQHSGVIWKVNDIDKYIMLLYSLPVYKAA